MLAANRAGGSMTMTERRFPNRLYVNDPGKSSLWFVGVQSQLGSRHSVRVRLPKPSHEPECHLTPALSPNKLAERESIAAVKWSGSTMSQTWFMVPLRIHKLFPCPRGRAVGLNSAGAGAG